MAGAKKLESLLSGDRKIGRAGRDGKPAIAIKFGQPSKLTSCLRKKLLDGFDLDETEMLLLDQKLDYQKPCNKECEDCFCVFRLCFFAVLIVLAIKKLFTKSF